jgi:hypothetical protein
LIRGDKMSADNWAICPKCKLANDKDNEKRLLDIGKKYGKIPADLYIEEAKKAAILIDLQETLREDYELYTDEDGMFHISYSCRCSECGFNHKFKHEKQLFIS